MFRLIRDPQHFDLIRNEVVELSDEIDYDTWRSMHATTAVFEEGLRLHPRCAFFDRENPPILLAGGLQLLISVSQQRPEERLGVRS